MHIIHCGLMLILHQILQIKIFWNKFHLKIHDVYYDDIGNRIWYVDFPDKEQYVLFVLEWS
jgi:hypothetical protein